jgi:hypothetical protein
LAIPAFSSAQFQRLVLVAHHFHLAFLQRHRLAGQRAGQFDSTQQADVFFKKARMIGQVLGDGGGVQCCGHGEVFGIW